MKSFQSDTPANITAGSNIGSAIHYDLRSLQIQTDIFSMSGVVVALIVNIQ